MSISNANLMDWTQVIKLCYNGVNSLNVNLTGTASMSILASQGDSILSVGTEDGTLGGTQHVAKMFTDGTLLTIAPQIASVATVPNGTTTGTVVIGPVSVVGIKNINVISNTTVNLTATSPLLTLQLSPSDTDNVWFSTSLTVTPSATANTVVTGTAISTNIYRRARVVFTDVAYAAGSFDSYLNGG